MRYYIGVDLGGTNIAVGICDENKKIIRKASRKTSLPATPEKIASDIFLTVKDVLSLSSLSMSDIEWIGIGSPGDVDPKTGEISFANSLGFKNTPFAEIFRNISGKQTFLENDATAAAYGEAIAGAGVGYKNILTVTIGTGIGGGVIIDGKTYGRFSGADNEIGHMGINPNGRLCSCGIRGCAETYCSAIGLIVTTKEYMKTDPDSKMWELVGGDIDKTSARTSFDAMRLGDGTAKTVVDEYIRYLAYAVTSYINLFEPQIVIIGGGICNEGETLLKPLRDLVYPNIYVRHNPKKIPEIVKAALGNDAGIIGAAMLGFNK